MSRKASWQPRTQGLLGSKARNEEGRGKLWSHEFWTLRNFEHFELGEFAKKFVLSMAAQRRDA